MQIAVCDDNKLHLLDMKEKLSSLQMVENMHFFSDLMMFLSSVEAGCPYDAVLMDIDWEHDKTGIAAAEELYKRNPEVKVIYITGYGEKYSQRVFLHTANLSGYITKPVNIEILKANLQKVADSIPFSEQPTVLVKQNNALIPIPCREIYYIESWKHTVNICSARQNITSYERLDRIIEALPPGFYQCHKSYIVNMRHIQRFQSDEILLKNGITVPVSRSKYNDTKKAYISFIGNMF